MKNIYDTRVRQAISDKYVEASKKLSQARNECNNLDQKMIDLKKGRIDMFYGEYLKLERDLEIAKRKLSDVMVELDIWDKAREICLDIADEIEGEKNGKRRS